MRMTPRSFGLYMEGYNVRFAMDMRLHGIKADIPQYGKGRQAAAPNMDALRRIREKVHARDAERAQRLGIKER